MLLLEGGCAQNNVDSEFLKIAKVLQSKTVPAEVKNLSTSNIVRSSSSAMITWRFEVNWQVYDYYQWSKAQLQSSFKILKQEPFSQEWTRALPGDIYNLQIEITQAMSPIHIRVTFISSAF